MDIEERKRIIRTVVIIAIVVVAGILLWRYFSRPQAGGAPIPPSGVGGRVPPGIIGGAGASGTPTPPPVAPGETVTTPTGQVLTHITDFPVVAPMLNAAENQIQFYKKDGGDLFTADFAGKNLEKISNVTVVGLTDAIWSPRKDRAAVFYIDGETKKGFVQIGTSSTALLPHDTSGFSWSPDGRSFAYLAAQNGVMGLVTADASGKNSRTAARTPIQDGSIQWTTPDTILFQTAPSGVAEGYLFSVSRTSGIFRRVLGPVFGLETLAAPDGNGVLASSAGQDFIRTFLLAASGTRHDLPFQTVPEKCVFTADAKRLYCAVPSPLPADFLWPDDFLKGAVHTRDALIRYDIAKNTAETILDDRPFDMESLVATKDQNHIFFVDRNDGTLWGLQIK